MKIQVKSMLFLLPLSFIFLMGCKKHEGDSAVTITVTDLLSKSGIVTGTFTTTGVLTISGTSLMEVHPAGDSSHCTETLTAKEGTIVLHYDCSNTNMSGAWHITDGTRKYQHLQGEGTLMMKRSSNSTLPAGVVGIEVLTGHVW